jgi:type 2 lantibiotic biosynthesis protein LanM
VPFPGLVGPFLSVGWERLGRLCANATAASHGPLVSESAAVDLLRGLAVRLRAIVTPTAVLELNVARLQDGLVGNTPEARFRHFAATQLAGRERLQALFAEYPALADQLVRQLASWIDASSELLTRLREDGEAIASTFGGARPRARRVGPGLSDPHRGGRSVCRLDFADGTRLVYKPKSMEIDGRFQRMLSWMNDRGLRHPHRVLRVLDRGSHGWVEFVDAAPCTSSDAVARFYWRLGSQLALLYVLQAVDFHFENLIASGEFPVPIDLESLFHRRVPAASTGALERARELLNHSVCSVGLLPALRWSTDGERWVDLSGMGGRNGDAYSMRVPRIQDAHTDTMRIATGDVKVAGGRNRPFLGEGDVEAADFADSIVDGFRETQALLTTYRSEFADLLAASADVVVRFIPRNTALYGRLLTDARHPDFLRDAAGLDRALDGIRQLKPLPDLERLLESERLDLSQGDVPFFTTRPASRDVWDSRERRFADYFAEDSLSSATRTLLRFDDADCRRQCGLIRQALVSTGAAAVAGSTAMRPEPVRKGPAGADEFLDAAVGIGDRLRAQAILGEEDATWIGLSLRNAESARFELRPTSFALYDGLAGIALFFAHLAAATGRSDFAEMARRAIRGLPDVLTPQASGVGGYSGRPSVLYALSRLGALWEDEVLSSATVDAELEKLPALIAADRSFDIIGGVAGCAAVLLTLWRERRDARLLESARACGERLLAAAVPQAVGLGWPGTIAPAAVAGFSHGAAGNAWILLELGHSLGEPRFREAAFRALEFERSLYVAEARNWRDRRLTPERLQDGSGWCNGGAGIALGRVLSLAHDDSPEVRREIEVGVERTLRAGFGMGQSLCHGDLGNADILLLAAERLGRDDWKQAALGHAARVCREVQAGHLRCGIPRFTETPALLNGIAGIGYGLLRLWSRETVPAVLWLG